PERGGVARRALAAHGVPVRHRTLRGGRDHGRRVALAVARDGAFGDGAELEPALGVADAPRGGVPPRAAQPLPRPAGLLGCGRTRSPRHRAPVADAAAGAPPGRAPGRPPARAPRRPPRARRARPPDPP